MLQPSSSVYFAIPHNKQSRSGGLEEKAGLPTEKLRCPGRGSCRNSQYRFPQPQTRYMCPPRLRRPRNLRSHFPIPLPHRDPLSEICGTTQPHYFCSVQQPFPLFPRPRFRLHPQHQESVSAKCRRSHHFRSVHDLFRVWIRHVHNRIRLLLCAIAFHCASVFWLTGGRRHCKGIYFSELLLATRTEELATGMSQIFVFQDEVCRKYTFEIWTSSFVLVVRHAESFLELCCRQWLTSDEKIPEIAFQ